MRLVSKDRDRGKSTRDVHSERKTQKKEGSDTPGRDDVGPGRRPWAGTARLALNTQDASYVKFLISKYW